MHMYMHIIVIILKFIFLEKMIFTFFLFHHILNIFRYIWKENCLGN